MKKSLIYLSVMALGLAGVVTSCDDNFERPPMVIPEATMEANTTIAELKTQFYNDGSNYAVEVGTRQDGSHYIIEGYVTTSDESGNYFKQVVIQDATSAVQIGIDAYDLYESYQIGQKIVLDVTGLYVGTYGKLFQIGAAPASGYPSRISEDAIAEHAQVAGLASDDNVAPTVVSIADLNAMAPSSTAGLEWQNRLITIEGVTFANAGKQTLSKSGSNGVSQNFGNADGSVILYTSGYSDFYDYFCPTGTGSVTGILSCYNASWQVRLIDIEGLQGFDELVKDEPGTPDNPDNPGTITGDGTEAKPYTSADVIGGATGSDVWVKGFIVGWVDGKTIADGARFDAKDVTAPSNILIAESADVKDVKKCVPVQLPAGDVRSGLNLKDNPGNLGKEVMIKGNLMAYFGQPGVKEVNSYKIDGKTPDTPDTPSDPVSSINENFDASTNVPAGWTQVQIAGNKKWYVATFQENNYISMTGYKGTAPFDQYLLTPPVDMSKVADKTLTFDTQVNGYGSKTSVIEVMVLDGPDPKTAKATKLDAKWATAPESGYSTWQNSGTLDLSSFTGTVYIAFRYSATADTSFATWCVDNVKLNAK